MATLAGVAMALALAGCGDRDTASPVAAPGAAKSATTRTLEAGAAVLQVRRASRKKRSCPCRAPRSAAT
jgi:hypothetical protein